MNETAIEVRNLHQSYGDFEAVRGIGFEVARGELYALLGTNGAGKTTTLDVLEGYHPPTKGEVRILGHDPVAERDAVRHRMGIVLQEAGFYKDLTVGETVAAWRRWTRDALETREALGKVGLEHREKVRVGQLSGGERRRLDLALAVLGRPEVLFLDEPTTGLDPEARRNVWELIRGMLADGVTVLLTTHYLDEAEQLAQRLAIMHQGRIVTEGVLADVLASRGTRITFRLPGFAGSDLPYAPGLARRSVVVNGDAFTVETDEPQEDLRLLLDWAHGRRLELGGLEVRRPTLEEVFLDVAQTEGVAA
ncbi:ABC transporter ATP-binding protein [Bailinhaonella thermotolerans]|uniref:ABC transporter ATP-binding protein n=1 Tax=Bailinhaonella thermotolerans TaxID=1070861 RepID=A0A3A4AWT7_9ACTN|nr:ABC transporter ATP-binding protein [Bailinhaonella thermotolerans]RJL34405.1 ABC transporter ATP-binding protein [Bailinhaonella thermotolerans]